MSKTPRGTNPAGDIDYPDAILATKLFIPPARHNLVPRPQLIARLNQSLENMPGVVLLSAPPGYGKTTLLSEWIRSLELGASSLNRGDDHDAFISANQSFENTRDLSPGVAWLSLDQNDNDPARFLAYCVAALQNIQPGFGQATVAMLRDPKARPTSPDVLITTLINEMVAVSRPFMFVLEDYHVINTQLIHDSLSTAIDNLPSRALLVVTSRTEPPLPLARLRGRGQLVELGPAELRFTADEVAGFLNNTMGLNLSRADVDALDRRTEGWVAGLQMAALSMQGVKDTAGFVKAFTGSHRHIMEYLLEEVLNRQEKHIQHFLLQTSILSRLSGHLCETVVAGSEHQDSDKPYDRESATRHSQLGLNGQGLLNQLEQANLFIIPLDDAHRWYRYHHLFADLLHHRLEQTYDSEAVANLHRRASDWYEQNGLAAEAMSHALAAADVERIIRLAKQKAAMMLSRSELVTVLSWLDTVPHELTRTQSRFPLVQAWAMALTGQLQAVETYLQEAERMLQINHPDPVDGVRADLFGEIMTLRATVAYFQRDWPQAIELYRRALENLSLDNLFLRGIVMQCLGAAYSWCGEVEAAARAYNDASTISLNSQNLPVALIALWNLARLQIEQGYLHQAFEVYQWALQLTKEQGKEELDALLSYAGRVYIGLAELMYHWNDLEIATKYAEEGLRLAEQDQESGALTGGYLVLAQIKQARGDLNGARAAVQQAAHFAQRYTGLRYLATQVATYQAKLWLAQGKWRLASNWIHNENLQLSPLPDPVPYLREGEYLLAARVLLAQGRSQQAEGSLLDDNPLLTATDLLDRVISAATEQRRMGCVLEALILQALVFQARDEMKQALNVLQKALSLAEPEGHLRYFINEGPPLADLLRQIAAQDVFTDYVSQLVTAIDSGETESRVTHRPAAAEPQFLVDPLSERELEILRLMATGMSNRELAEELVVTVGTVKWHLNNIYSKLAVRSRTQAVAKARELGLL